MRDDGFTLLELLAVLAILALVAGLLVGRPPTARTETAARLRAELVAARTRARLQGRVVTVPLPTGGTVRFYPDGGAEGGPVRLDGRWITIDPALGTVEVR